MRAAVCRTFGEPLVVEDLSLDPIGPDEVRVEVAACAICHSDIHYADGSWGGALPAVYGHEAAGTVAEIGEGVRDVAAGDRVAMSLIRSCGECSQCRRGYEVFCEADLGPPAHRPHTAEGETVEAALRCGAFAEEDTVHHSQVVPIPGDLDWPAAARLEIDPLELADTGRRIVGCRMGSAQPRRDTERIVAWHRDGALKLDELVSGLYPLDEINEAIAVVKRGEAIRNVISMRDL